MNCTNCGALVPVARPGQTVKCPKCGTTLNTGHASKKNPTRK
jgi:predicted RNA-binding Zn-ribbon protein involved in translation (DUF1610 family)